MFVSNVPIVVVEDHRLLQQLVATMCQLTFGCTVVGTSGDGIEAVSLIAEKRPRVAIVDLHLPGQDGFAVARAVRRLLPDIRLIAFSSYLDDMTVHSVTHSGFDAYVDKNMSEISVLGRAIETVIQGRGYFTERFLAARARLQRNPLSFDKVLSEREREVLTLIGQFLSDADIGSRIAVSEATAKQHRRNIMARLGLHSTPELIQFAIRNGFVRPEGIHS